MHHILRRERAGIRLRLHTIAHDRRRARTQMPEPLHRRRKCPAHQLRRALSGQLRAGDAAQRGKARLQAREGRIRTVCKQNERRKQARHIRPEAAAAQRAPRAAPEYRTHAEEHRRRKHELHKHRRPPQHQRREQHAEPQPARQPLARPALQSLLAAVLCHQFRARAEHCRERRGVRADRPERHREGIPCVHNAAHAEHRPQARLHPGVRARAAQLRRPDRHVKARALYTARDLAEVHGHLVISQARAAGRVAHGYFAQSRNPLQRTHDAHRAGAAVHTRNTQDHVRHFCRRLS